MNESAALSPTVPGPPPHEAPPTPGTVADPYRTAGFFGPPPTETVADLPQVPGFQIEKELARGGMGVVFQARDTALNRMVAVKLLQEKYPPDSAVAARFLEEAQITGQLQHPGIPPIYQVGTLGDGRPFLAMKLIKGETLDAKIKRGEKINYLALTEAIAQAVGYAHAHGVIHRDLKPQNIMVGAFGEVQVMDWGLAKLLSEPPGLSRRSDTADAPPTTTLYNPRTGAGSSETQAGSVLGTPAYMSPEQAAGEITKIDQRSDVFGLGSVLCCMLTGEPPYTGTDPFAIMVNASRGKTAEAFARLDACGAEPEVIALCKRCLAFEPGDRPTDGNAVAQEIATLRTAAEERAKRAEIDHAKAEVFAAEQRKRRRVWLGLAATLLAGLVVSLGLAAWAWTERNQKEEQRQAAVEQADLANGVKNFLQHDVLQLADPATQQLERMAGRRFDANVTLRYVILRASKAIDFKFPTQPLVEAELRATLSFTLLNMGKPDLAVSHLERLRVLCTTHWGPDHPDTLACLVNLTNCYDDLGRYTDALKLRTEILAQHQAARSSDHIDTLMAMQHVANSYITLGRHTEAHKLNQDAVARFRSALGPLHHRTLKAQSNLAENYWKVGQQAEAIPLQEQALTGLRTTLGSNHPDTLTAMHRLANYYDYLDRGAEALPLFEEAHTRSQATRGPDHLDTLGCLMDLANCYAAHKRFAQAQATGRELIRRLEERQQRHPQEKSLVVTLAGACCNLATCLGNDGKPTDALPWYAKAQQQLEQYLSQEPRNATARLYLRNVHFCRAQTLEQLHRFPEADADWAKAIALSPPHEVTAMKQEQARYKRMRAAPSGP